jgi:hypothetical protein
MAAVQQGLEAAIKRPLAVVQELFAQHANGGDPDAAHDAIVKHFEAVLANPAALQQVIARERPGAPAPAP